MGGSLLVTFGPGLEVSSATLSTSSPMITIHNLPSSTKPQDIHLLLLPHKRDIENTAIRIVKTEELVYATVNLGDPVSVKRVIDALDGSYHKNNKLSVKPLLKKGRDITSSQDATRVSCTWYAPTKKAFAIYNSASEARVAATKESRIICGRPIKCKIADTTSGDPGTTTISMGGLDVRTTLSDIKKSFRCDDVKLGAPTYDLTEEEAVVFVRSLFESGKRLQGFEVVSQPNAVKVKAIVRFRTAEEARNAIKEIHGVKQEFLGDSPLHVSQVFSAKFKVLPDVYRAVTGELADITKKARGAGFVRVKVYEGVSPISPVTISVNGPERATVASTKTAVQKLVRGEVLCDEEGVTLWDPFLATTQGIGLIKSLIASTGSYIYFDLRKRQLSIYGTPKTRTEARIKLIEAISRANRQSHVIPLEMPVFQNIMRGGLKALQEQFGKERTSLDIATKCIVFQGSTSEAEHVGKALTKLLRESKTPTPRDGEENCLICLTKAEEPRITPCGHLYCQACLQGYLKSVIDTRNFPIKCVGTQDTPTCASEFPLPFIQKVLAKVDLDNLFEAAFGDFIQRHLKDYQYCPTPDCCNVYSTTTDGELITCPECFAAICTRCNVDHDGQTCGEYKSSMDTEGETQFKEWKESKGVKACPTCKSAIEKTDGCNHMVCTTCKSDICWECMGIFAKDMIYDHMNSKHGGIGI